MTRECKQCHGPFEAKNSRHTHCGPDCAYQTTYDRAMRAYYESRVLRTETRLCKICSAPYQWEGRRHKTTVCGDRCRAKNDSRNNCRYALRRAKAQTPEQRQAQAEHRREYMRQWRAKRSSDAVDYW
jgi:hypothetical protein